MRRLWHGERVGRNGGIILKSDREIELLRLAGRVVRCVLNRMEEMAAPGVRTAELSSEAEDIIRDAGGIPLFRGVEAPQAKFPFPAAICASVNEELVHGIPNDRVLRDGDILSVDCGVRLNGYCGDAATTIAVGTVSEDAKHLMGVTREALGLAIERIKPGRMWSEVAVAIQAFVEGHGLSVVRDFVGHGIGRDMHEDPKVPNYWDAKQERFDFEMVPNLVIAVEPMVNLGSHRVEYRDEDRWTVVTRDGRFSAHYEHTVAVTPTGADVLTAMA